MQKSIVVNKDNPLKRVYQLNVQGPDYGVDNLVNSEPLNILARLISFDFR
jgi:hypothetical protein